MSNDNCKIKNGKLFCVKCNDYVDYTTNPIPVPNWEYNKCKAQAICKVCQTRCCKERVPAPQFKSVLILEYRKIPNIGDLSIVCKTKPTWFWCRPDSSFGQEDAALE